MAMQFVEVHDPDELHGHAYDVVLQVVDATRLEESLMLTPHIIDEQQKIVLARLTQNNAAEVLRMAQESYDAGMITASELMQAQTAWLAAATDLVDAEVEAKTTETQLRKFLGKL